MMTNRIDEKNTWLVSGKREIFVIKYIKNDEYISIDKLGSFLTLHDNFISATWWDNLDEAKSEIAQCASEIYKVFKVKLEIEEA